MMTDRSIGIGALKGLTCAALASAFLAGQPGAASAQGNAPAFGNSSLRGDYAYVNNTGDVASLGPIVFDGAGGLTLRLITSLPCPTPGVACQRGSSSFDAEGTYSVKPDGTGTATIDFPAPFGPIVYDFVIVKAERRGPRPLALEVFSAAKSGGLAGQLIAPTWTRVFNN
jgi:hypothetical protein